jgi:hypothetical protein
VCLGTKPIGRVPFDKAHGMPHSADDSRRFDQADVPYFAAGHVGRAVGGPRWSDWAGLVSDRYA